MLHAHGPPVIGVAAGLQDIVKADEVGLYVHVRVLYGVPHPRLGRQVHHHRRFILGKELVYQRLFRHIAPDEAEAAARLAPLFRQFLQLCQAILLQAHLVVVVHAVYAHHMDTLKSPQQLLGEESAYEACSSRDQHRFIVKRNVHNSLLQFLSNFYLNPAFRL